MVPRLKKSHPVIKHCVLHSDEEEVQSGLSVSPSQMAELTQQGIPISPQNLGLGFEDGVSDLDFEPPLHLRRGVDMNDLYEARENVRGKLKKVVFDSNNLETSD